MKLNRDFTVKNKPPDKACVIDMSTLVNREKTKLFSGEHSSLLSVDQQMNSQCLKTFGMNKKSSRAESESESKCLKDVDPKNIEPNFSYSFCVIEIPCQEKEVSQQREPCFVDKKCLKRKSSMAFDRNKIIKKDESISTGIQEIWLTQSLVSQNTFSSFEEEGNNEISHQNPKCTESSDYNSGSLYLDYSSNIAISQNQFEPFILILDACNITVSSVTSLEIPWCDQCQGQCLRQCQVGAKSSSDREQFYQCSLQTGKKIEFESNKWSLRIWDGHQSTGFGTDLVIAVKITYTTLPEGKSLKWVLDQDNKPKWVPDFCSAMHGICSVNYSKDPIVPCRLFAPKSLLPKAMREIKTYIPKCLLKACSILGPYPFCHLDILIVPTCFDSLGMASPCLIYLSQSVLAGDGSFCSRLAHEICHSWFGLIIGPKDWTEEWMTEGFAKFLEDTIHCAMNGLSDNQSAELLELRACLKYRVLTAELDHTDTQLQIMRPNKDVSEEAKNSYIKDAMNPEKKCMQGYFMLRDFSKKVGMEPFQNFLKLYVSEYHGQLVTSQDFLQLLFKTFPELRDEGLSETQIYSDWLDEAGLPKPLRDYQVPMELSLISDVYQKIYQDQVVLFLELLLDADLPKNLLKKICELYTIEQANPDNIDDLWKNGSKTIMFHTHTFQLMRSKSPDKKQSKSSSKSSHRKRTKSSRSDEELSNLDTDSSDNDDKHKRKKKKKVKKSKQNYNGKSYEKVDSNRRPSPDDNDGAAAAASPLRRYPHGNRNFSDSDNTSDGSKLSHQIKHKDDSSTLQSRSKRRKSSHSKYKHKKSKKHKKHKVASIATKTAVMDASNCLKS